MREKLIRVLCNAHNKVTDASLFDDATYAQQIEIEADYLIENGVTFDKDINALTKKVARLEKSNRNWRRKHQRLKADAVSRGYHEQVRWERDIAIEQLEEYGISLGEKTYVVKLPYEPTPFLKDNNPHNTDAYCPECGTNLSGYYGGEALPIVTCFECGEIINPYMAMTKDELAEWRKENKMKEVMCDVEIIKVDNRKSYVVFPDCPFRLVFEDNEYVGWYYAGEVE